MVQSEEDDRHLDRYTPLGIQLEEVGVGIERRLNSSKNVQDILASCTTGLLLPLSGQLIATFHPLFEGIERYLFSPTGPEHPNVRPAGKGKYCVG